MEDQVKFARLRRFNLIMGFLHATQSVVVLLLANSFALPVTATFLEGPPGAGNPPLTSLFEVSIAWGVAIFLFLSAAAHWIIASPGVFDWYVRNLKKDRNYAPDFSINRSGVAPTKVEVPRRKPKRKQSG